MNEGRADSERENTENADEGVENAENADEGVENAENAENTNANRSADMSGMNAADMSGVNAGVNAGGRISGVNAGGRFRKTPAWMNDYVSREDYESSDNETNLALLMSDDSVHYEKAVQDVNWRIAMDNEVKSIEKNKTWTLVTAPGGCKVIGVRWI